MAVRAPNAVLAGAVVVPRATRLAPWPGLAKGWQGLRTHHRTLSRRSLLAAPAIVLVASSLMPLCGARAQSQLKGDWAKKRGLEA